MRLTLNHTSMDTFTDVETTNWNAVKLIAVKYGINLKSPEEIRDSMRTHKRTQSTQEDDNALANVNPSEEEDLGFGTPFRILARPQADGRTVYHLTRRVEEKYEKRGGKLQITTTKAEDEEADEAGYDPGLDSPSSSIRKQRRKQPSNRTLRVARSISAFRALNSSGGSTAAAKSTDSKLQHEEEKGSDACLAQSDISSSSRPEILQRGDVLGAILGLRQGINADDYSWTDSSPISPSPSKLGKGKHRQDQRIVSGQDKSSAVPSARPSDGTWRSISPFGAPVLQRDRSASIRNDAMNKWNRSPIPRMTDMGQPLFGDMTRMFISSPQPDASTKDEVRAQDDNQSETDSLSGVSSIIDSGEPDLIFDVLQNYSQNRQSIRSTASSASSPAPSSLGSSKHQRERSSNSAEPEEISTSVLPGDDPRFALWAVRNRSEEDDALVLCSRRGEIDVQAIDSPKISSSPWIAKRASVKSSASSSDVVAAAGGFTPKNVASPSPSTKKITSEGSQHNILYPKSGAFLLAASMPYIVAELTSHIDNRFMTDFFYTYRAFTTPHELLRLLILRFRWSLKDDNTAKEEAKRKIVRVRTYVVIKYWITNFFTFDFLPDRRLRTQFTDWLNSSSQDPTLLARPADLAIIKNLKKIVRNLKSAYENVGIGGLLMADATRSPKIPESNSHPEGLTEAGSDPAVNLEIGEEGFEESYDCPTVVRSPSDSAMLQKSSSATDQHQHQHHIHAHKAPPPLPTSQGAFSRAFLNTFSRISRFTRHLNARHSISPLMTDGVGIESSNIPPKPCGDLLFVRGGLESFLEYFDLHPTNSNNGKDRVVSRQGATQSSGDESQDQASDATFGAEEGTPSLSSNQTRSTPASSFDFHRGSPINSNSKANFGLGIQDDSSAAQDEDVGIAITSEEIHQLDLQPDDNLAPQSNTHLSATHDMLHHFQSDQTLRSAMKEDEPRSNGLRIGGRQGSQPKDEDVFTSQNRLAVQGSNIVQIDDIDLSSDEEDGMVRKALRRLPGARDLRMAQNVTQLEAPVRQSFESISSLGRVYGGEDSRRSLASYYGNDENDLNGAIESDNDSERNVQHFTSVVTSEMLDPDEALRGYELVKGFRLEHLEESDEEESGDVEAALRRLEGVIDEDKQRERARKVERMWERSQAQKREDQARKTEIPKTSSLLRSYEAAAATDLPADTTLSSIQQQNDDDASLRVVSASPSPSQQSVVKRSGHSRHPSSVSTAHDAMRARMVAETPLPAPQRTKVSTLPVHRSFLLDYRSDVIAQQFSLIEMELFRAVAWQELVTGQWKVRNHRGQVLDWEVFYQERARNRVESQNQTANSFSTSLDSSMSQNQLESSIEAITARFNLTCNWVASEIVMTNTLDARAAVVRKLIRIAWKCYHQSNFATLTQIILGLQSPWIERLGKTWSRVGALEMRMLRDLKAFINPARNFKHLRNAMREMIVGGHMEDLITSTGPPQMHSMNVNSTSSASNQSTRSNGIAMNDGCIPFFGLFLSDLAVHDALPTLVEPSLPDAEVNVDPNTGHLTKLADPNAFDHLPQLPKNIRLSPLVNLYKYRILAMTVKTVLALQDRLDAFNFRADKDAYVKALKLRCLEAEQLTVISHVAEP